MDWNDARLLDQIAYDLKLADYLRGKNRARIDNLANGVPPYTDEEVRDNNINVNVNFLECTTRLHEARMQFTQNFLKNGSYFKCTTDMGAQSKRSERSGILTREVSRVMKKSVSYFEHMRSKSGLLMLHGIAPAVWENRWRWCPRSIGVEDALLPSGTLLGFENLPFFSIYRSFTAYELQRLAVSANPDPGWRIGMVKKVIEWADKNATSLMGSTWPEVWSPEKLQERIKGDGGFYASDRVPTIDCFDIYAYVETGKKAGWIRRIILDAWGEPSQNGTGYTMNRRSDMSDMPQDKFLYSSGRRQVANSWTEIVGFQFADLSAVAPFRYHSVRSLGFLLYAVCHLQNRLRCKFTEAVMEALMMYFKVKSMDDAQKALKVELANRGFIDDTIMPVPASERYSVPAALVELGLSENASLISSNSSSFTQPTNAGRDRVEKTKFQVMAEMQSANSLIAAGIMQAYQYQQFEYNEILRRFLQKNSRDPQVNSVRARVLAAGIPESMLIPEAWVAEPDRVLGGGNKTLELAISEAMMERRPLYDPSAQRDILRDYTLSLTDDPARAERLVPEQPGISDSIHDAQLTIGALMQGAPVGVKSGVNRGEYCQTLIVSVAVLVGRTKQSGGVPTREQLTGLLNSMQFIDNNLKLMEQDEESKGELKQLRDQYGNLQNEIRAFAQRLQEQQQQQQQNGNAGIDPKAVAQIQGKLMIDKAKADNTKQSHAQRTVQRQIQFEHEEHRRQVEFENEQARKNLEAVTEAGRKRLSAADEK